MDIPAARVLELALESIRTAEAPCSFGLAMQHWGVCHDIRRLPKLRQLLQKFGKREAGCRLI